VSVAAAETELRGAVEAQTVGDLIHEAARRTPDGLAVVFPGERLTFAELRDRVELVARGLIASQVEPGEHVGILMPNCAELVAALLAIARVGAISVPISTRAKGDEREHLLSDAQIRLLVDESFDADALEAAASNPERARRSDEIARRAGAVTPEQVATILYTSGTTSQPKGCLLQHRALVWQALRYRWGLGITSDDRYWIPLEMFHVGGIVGVYACLAAEAVFCHPGHFEAGRALEMLESERVTVAAPVFETIWMRVLTHPRYPATDLSALERVLNIGPPERLRHMQARMPGVLQLNGCGSTELCGQLGVSRRDDPPELREVYSSLMPGVEVRIIDHDSGVELAPHQAGELLVRGPGPFIGYHNDPELTRAVIDPEGWVHTGDVSVLDGEGRIHYAGRIKDTFKVGGENVAPAEVEDYLARHFAVQIVSVVGVADARYGEVPAAFVELAPGTTVSEPELIAFCVDQIASFKVPRYVRFVTDWPMSGTKIRKAALRTALEAELAALGITEAPRFRAGSAASSDQSGS
jgi:fatty-acyl-CoA synthase